MSNPQKIKIDEIEYVRKDSIENYFPAPILDDKEYCIVRTYSAGVFAGYINRSNINGTRGQVYNSRRIWEWRGAASLSQLAIKGTSNPSGCKFAMVVPEEDLTQIIEVIPCTEIAKKSIDGVKVWEA